ncbi:polyprotein (retrotrasposon protein) [Pyrus ussuriensis x Pyrus communis]|uniref:Polyprotein (Retrotrasposon protein) n=1 Tax=Pyrus ussuriensis x Pyrus communis TaxID=2448454 RepID=A0A5N5I0D9_9ROSA|nr:polyprotein (retrotrasposon protein) [Pyrus ussuriensis x Pyrus communis]
MDSGGSGVMRLEGSNSTNNQVVNPIVIQSDASAVKSFRLRQEGRPVGVYYADLKPIRMVCAVDLKTLREEVQIDRVYAFLAGLDDVFDKVRSDILRTQPLPSVEEVFSVVRREAQRHATMMGGSNNQGGLPSMAMISRPAGINRSSNSSNQSLNSRPFNRENKDDLKCTFCGQTRHTEDTCFTKHGVPDWFPELKKKLRAKERGAAGSSGGRASLAAATPAVQEAVPSPGDSGQNLLTRTQGASSSDTGTMGHVLLASEKQHHTGWILDSGATDHMTYDKNMFQYMTTSHRKNISTANGTLAPVCGAGTVHLTPSLPLHHCLLVPSLSHHLLSIPQVTEQLDCVVLMYPSFCLLQDIQTKEIIGRGTKREGLYYVDDVVSGRAHAVRASRSSNLQAVWLLHRRLGHASFGYLRHMLPSLFSGINESDLHCEVCILAKSHRASFPPSMNKRALPFELVHSDVWGPSPVVTSSGIKWFVTFVDDCTRMTWLYVLQNKSDVGMVFRNFSQMLRTQYFSVIKVLRSDNGGEYINRELSEFLGDQGILHETTCPYTPQQNGVAERKNRHILETARALLLGASVPKVFWPEAVTYAVYVINRMPSRVVHFQTPFQVLTQHVPVVSSHTLQPRVFGCVAYVHIQKIHRTKLDPCALRCVFVGFSSHQKGYKCYHPATRHMYVTMDVTFSESEYFYAPVSSSSDPQGESSSDDLKWLDLEGIPVVDAVHNGAVIIHAENDKSAIVAESSMQSGPVPDESDPESDKSPTVTESSMQSGQVVDEPTNVPPSLSSSTVLPNESSLDIPEVSIVDDYVTNTSNDVNTYKLPPRQNRGVPPNRFSPEGKVKYPIANYVSCNGLAPERKTLVDNMEATRVPTRVEEALKDQKWANAMDEEMLALQKNNTWEVTSLPEGKKTVGCRWVFTVKYKANGSIDRYKARLVAKGYTQTYGVDYQETFSPVAKMNTVRVLISLAANMNWPLKQFDVKNAFLHGNLEEEVYMDFPPGYSAGRSTGVCRLRKSLYGLKQSPRAWFDRFTQVMKKIGYYQSHSDHTLFVKRRQEKVTALIIYVDDMIITGDDCDEISRLQRNLAAEFEMKNLGDLKYFLGVEVARSSKGIFLSQRKYVLDLLKETGMLGCKPVDTPIVEKHHLCLDPNQKSVDKGRYQRLVGRLIYLAHTRPDIAYAVSVVSQFMHSPSEDHMAAVMRILAYLKSAPGKGVLYRKHGHLRIEGFTDADWAGSVGDRRSTSGYFTFVGGNLVTWRSKKQKVVSRSSAEAEFRGMAHGICELLWLRKLLEGLGFKPKETMRLYCDNKSARDIADNPVQHDRTKHVEVDRHFIKEKLERKIVSIPFVSSDEQLADVLTHAVCSREHTINADVHLSYLPLLGNFNEKFLILFILTKNHIFTLKNQSWYYSFYPLFCSYR